MKKISIYLIAALSVVLAGCSSSVKYGYDKDTNFNAYKTYSWSINTQSNQLDETTITNAKKEVNRQLAVKGLTEVSSDPDFHIFINIDRVLVWDTDNSYPDLRYRYQSYKSRGALVWATQYEKGLISLDFVSAESQNVIWQGSIKKVIDAVQVGYKGEEYISEAVSKILVNYPPPLK
jgi:hypothetical protein